jgi:GT2 family glycosyltransferase
LLLFLDDDIILEADCVEQMMALISEDQTVVGVFGDFNNQPWPNPTRAWRFYLRHILRMNENEWQGRVVGPLLRFGYTPPPTHAMPIEWMGTCNTMVRRSAYEQSGGFSDFFLHRCTSNEDVDLGLKLCRLGRILFCPDARMGHFHAPGGRVSVLVAAEDELYNRYMIMRHTQRRSAPAAFGLAFLYFLVETAGSVLGCLKRRRIDGFAARACGRSRALLRILFTLRTPA